MRTSQTVGIGLAVAVVLAFALALSGESRSAPEILELERVSVTGLLHAVEHPDPGDGMVEIESDLDGRYRIDASGLGPSLRKHVGEAVTVVGTVRPFKQDGLPLLRVDRFTVYASS